MKVLFVCYEDMGGYSGSNRQVIEIVKNFQKLGHEVKLSTPLINRMPKDLTLDIEYIPVVNLPVIRGLSYLLLSPLYLMKIFFNFRPDAVFFFEIYLDIGPLLACKVFNCPLTFYINGIAREELVLRKTPNFIISIIELVQKLYSKYANTIFTVTEVIKEYVHREYNVPLKKIDVLKTAVDIEEFIAIDIKDARNRIGLDENIPVIGFCGGLYPWSGIEYLIDSVPLVLKKVPNAKFIIVGGGRTKETFVNRAESLGLKEKITFTGAVPFKDVPFYINTFDICVIFFKPVRINPGDPQKLYEYLACGRPVVASDAGGYGNFVEKIGAGVSVDASNSEKLAHELVRLIKDKSLRTEMGRNARIAMTKNHTWLARAEYIEKTLKETVF